MFRVIIKDTNMSSVFTVQYHKTNWSWWCNYKFHFSALYLPLKSDDWPVLSDKEVVPVWSPDEEDTGRGALHGPLDQIPFLVLLRAPIQQWDPKTMTQKTEVWNEISIMHSFFYSLMVDVKWVVWWHTVTSQSLCVASPCPFHSWSTSDNAPDHWLWPGQSISSSTISAGQTK